MERPGSCVKRAVLLSLLGAALTACMAAQPGTPAYYGYDPSYSYGYGSYYGYPRYYGAFDTFYGDPAFGRPFLRHRFDDGGFRHHPQPVPRAPQANQGSGGSREPQGFLGKVLRQQQK